LPFASAAPFNLATGVWVDHGLLQGGEGERVAVLWSGRTPSAEALTLVLTAAMAGARLDKG